MTSEKVSLAHDRLSIVIHPLQGDDTSLALSSFTLSVDALRKVINKFRCKDLRIVSVTSNSPITLTVADAFPEFPSVDIFFNGLKSFKETEEIPIAWPRAIIDSVLELLAPVGKSVARFSLVADNNILELDTKYKMAFEEQVQSDFSAVGTVDGMLEAVNIHGKKNNVALYPIIGNNKITLDFNDAQLEKIKEHIGRYVQISGELTYRWRDKYPYTGIITKIEHVNEEGLPTFKNLFGIAPNATRGVPAEEFITRIRSEGE